MSYNWNITDGDIYVSKNGNDVTGDGSMSLPYASLNKGFLEIGENEKIVVGTGIWAESITNGSQPDVFILEGDGSVIFSYYAGAFFKIWYPYGYNSNVTHIYRNIELQGYLGSEVTFLNGDWRLTGDGYYDITFENFRIFGDSIGTDAASTRKLKNCLIVNGKNEFKNSSIYNSTVIDTGGDRVQYTPALAENCIMIGCSSYYYTVYNHCLIYNPGLNDRGAFLNCITLDPKFNNEDIGDYTLQSTSPCLFAGKNSAHIGAYGIGYNYNPNSSEFTEEGGAIFSQSDQGNGLENDIVAIETETNGIINKAWIFTTSHDEGNIESEWIDFQKILYLKVPNLFANFIYDENGVATGRVDNLSATGDYPNAYDFEIKTSIDEAGKDTSVWKNVRWNELLTEDNSGNGNADESYDPLTSKEITARFVKLKIYMKQ